MEKGGTLAPSPEFVLPKTPFFTQKVLFWAIFYGFFWTERWGTSNSSLGWIRLDTDADYNPGMPREALWPGWLVSTQSRSLPSLLRPQCRMPASLSSFFRFCHLTDYKGPLVCDGNIESIFSPSLTWSPHMETWPSSLLSATSCPGELELSSNISVIC